MLGVGNTAAKKCPTLFCVSTETHCEPSQVNYWFSVKLESKELTETLISQAK